MRKPINTAVYSELHGEHCPNHMPHETTAHECEVTIFWYDVYRAYGSIAGTPVHDLTATVPHCLNARCDCTQRAAEALVARIETDYYGRARRNLIRTDINVQVPPGNPCWQRRDQLERAFLDLVLSRS